MTMADDGGPQTGRRRDLLSSHHCKRLILLVLACCLCIAATISVAKYALFSAKELEFAAAGAGGQRNDENAVTVGNWGRREGQRDDDRDEEEVRMAANASIIRRRGKIPSTSHGGNNATATSLNDDGRSTAKDANTEEGAMPARYDNGTFPSGDTGGGNSTTTSYLGALTRPPSLAPRNDTNSSHFIISKNASSSVQKHVVSPSSSSPSSYNYNFTSDIHLVSLTVRDDFYVLFNMSAVTSWIEHIRNVRSITFIGPPGDYELFRRNMALHYPNIPLLDADDVEGDADAAIPPVRWANETHWITAYKNRYRCPYPSVCQQLIKLYVFDLRTRLGMRYIGNNVLVVDSDTVWGRNVTFVDPVDGKVTYFEVGGREGRDCQGMDAVKFTEAITAGRDQTRQNETMSPYEACRRPEHPNATGRRHIVHHMLFQHDVMMHLHSVVEERWGVTTLWQAFKLCSVQEFCKSRIAEYELYHAFVSRNYPERVRHEALTNGEDYMGSSAICDAREMRCCEKRGVLLKGCHDHRVKMWRGHPESPASLGDMCCSSEAYGPEDAMAIHGGLLVHGL